MPESEEWEAPSLVEDDASEMLLVVVSDALLLPCCEDCKAEITELEVSEREKEEAEEGSVAEEIDNGEEEKEDDSMIEDPDEGSTEEEDEDIS